MSDKNTFYFCPGSFVDVMKTDLGDRVMRAIISNQSTNRMKTAVELGLPPIAGCIHVLCAKIGAQDLSRLRVKQFIGLVVKEYMDFLGYCETGKTQKLKFESAFIKKGLMFKKKESAK